MFKGKCVPAAVLAMVAGGSAVADNFWFKRESVDDFSNINNWVDKDGVKLLAVPGHDDRAIIPADQQAELKDGVTITIDTLRIEKDGNDRGELVIEGTGNLILENDDLNCGLGTPFPSCSTVDNSLIDGTLLLQTKDAGGVGAAGKLTFKVSNHIIAGVGQITSSKKPRAVIEIDGDITFTNELDQDGWGINGAFEINGLSGATHDGKIINSGIVESWSSFSQDIIIDAVTEDEDDGRWIASCPARITFKRAAILSGDFEDSGNFGINGGTFQFDADITTCGTYFRSGCGGLEFNNNASFIYSIFDDLGSGCINPGSSILFTCGGAWKREAPDVPGPNCGGGDI